MPDPFERLRTPITPIDPDPEFAARLRARVERALTLPKGVPVSTVELHPEPVTIVPRVTGAAVPYLAVADGRRALDWYVDVLGARRRGEPIVMDDGRIGHAELELAGGVVYLAEPFPEIGHAAPRPGGTPVSLVLEVADVDRTVAAAVAAGAELTRPVGEGHGSRNATIVDPFGHRWMLQTPLAGGTGEPAPLRPGDVAYASLWVPDAARAADFFSAVLGWRFEGEPAPGHAVQVVGTTPAQGIFGGQERATLFTCLAVADLDDALDRVRRAGGQPGEARREAYGRVADCTDDQGTPFALVEVPEPASIGTDRPVNGRRQGDISYLTHEVRDADRARAFYGAVLGWQFVPGRTEEGWQVLDVAPMTGLHGGHDVATGVPMFRVDDVAAAVARVRAAGGTATDPERRPYGISADCVDDQGTRFSLGEL
ncbi:MAG TPA: VOC family protein [Acidimicrobiia bacterium]|nr:VOC family protein [Acidimicrobiia bacterium]